MDLRIQEAIANLDVVRLTETFLSSWQTLGQGEQKALSSCFVRTVLASSNFLKIALNKSNDRTYHSALQVFKTALSNLPSFIENGGDNKLREAIFEHLVELDEYREAANILAGYRFDDDENSPYYSTPDIQTDIYVKVAECFLNEDDIVEADTFVSKAGASAQLLSTSNNNVNDQGRDKNTESEDSVSFEGHYSIILRYKSTYARVLDANRKFLAAAGRYYDLSVLGRLTDMIDADDLLEFFGRAVTCAILAPSSSHRKRILGMLYNDERVSQLDTIGHFASHSSILTKMYMEQIIRRDHDMITFENSLADHQKAVMGDGLTIFQRAIIEHNMVAVSRIYSNIHLASLAVLLSLSPEKTEKVACKMILDGSLVASIDQVDGMLYFDQNEEKHGEKLLEWDSAISGFCTQINYVVDSIRQKT
jgi:26S proteasome regulatory complex component